MTFEQFSLKLDPLPVIDRGNGHWQVKLPTNQTVNYYPLSSSRTVYMNPVGELKGRKLENQTYDMVILLVQGICKGETYYDEPSQLSLTEQ